MSDHNVADRPSTDRPSISIGAAAIRLTDTILGYNEEDLSDTLKAIAALTLLSPFVPLLFQGEEWGARTPFQYFTDHEDPALGRAVGGPPQHGVSSRW